MSQFSVLVTDNISEEGLNKLTWDKTHPGRYQARHKE